ncbi:metal ABC transporter substrate-binding protein [Deinococcus cellulosilyticus]|uniref:Metal ABC transporter substrate-binding protein n=1 Tax=Deinococcus cellulosilyticus (strain DSM 18568 / NBRC 106333 / KACC 11606 / 5516J-15) TaxID=1223518 RepID=A0A511N8B4_DEIC1|nr:metal ABC transporter substrate-binding protein [Deinococcus cellulosilyticus]GEM48757.1 metal ABC transporter substrate-binding protein [Deinococcus cellulosilyticus NBRC 106333 = KACC 11606]
MQKHLIFSALLLLGTAEAQKKVVLTTFTIIQDMARNVAGDKLEVVSITKPGTEIHGYEPTPSDLVKAQKADLILNNGFNLEKWFERFYQKLQDVPRVTLTDGIKPMNITEGTYEGKPNPHTWMSPKNALVYVENIRKAFVKLDPQNAEVYNRNAKAYSAKIKALDAKLGKALKALPGNNRYLVSCEGAFSYLTRDYGLKEAYMWPINAEQQGTPRQVQKVIDTVKKNKIPVVFCETTVSDKAQRQVARETGARFGGNLFVDSLSAEGGQVPTYLKLLEYDINTLIQGLKP